MTEDLRVLVVDDSADLRMLIGLTLEAEPTWTIVGEAGDGAQGLALARSLYPDLVLVDAAMPVMDGLEALPRLRALLPDALLVVLTAFPSGTLDAEAARAGADACLDKLDLVEDLVPAVRDLLRAAHLPDPRPGCPASASCGPAGAPAPLA